MELKRSQNTKIFVLTQNNTLMNFLGQFNKPERPIIATIGLPVFELEKIEHIHIHNILMMLLETSNSLMHCTILILDNV